ncbi:response regulator [Undibacterium sp. TS12]|uniref:response regulator n=1 Tax=Undibacterium sp. TS12 TaxID=2908202 RepID=UPI001F4CDFE9|nr:response regulator [Undibacterium sp. TS12]MCH8618327.1 response regulator [Undibacterium sp. TS12]
MARILIIEDNPVNMKLAAFLLQNAGHEVLQAVDAEQGMQVAHDMLPDLILMDMQLPGIDGITATRQLKTDAATAQIKIIALTAFAMSGDEERFRAAGCDAYMAKPIRYQAFLSLVDAMLKA